MRVQQAARAARRLWARIEWGTIGKFVGEGAAKAVGALLVYALVVYILVIVIQKRRGGSSKDDNGSTRVFIEGAAQRAIAMRTGGLLDPAAQQPSPKIPQQAFKTWA